MTEDNKPRNFERKYDHRSVVTVSRYEMEKHKKKSKYKQQNMNRDIDIYEQLFLKKMSPGEVSKIHGISKTRVYQIEFRFWLILKYWQKWEENAN